ncbi:error-prone DNA polymerase [Anaerotruncus sp. 2789STDY5834896]|uniref:Error-prone DNA polymerase n=1 Tax=uncultured Anaerotruncus sp. TaxID=905011 RepID=A0A1C6HZA3_9FIRM|nr:error-prone DNA polymerase [uncultured Anaerotruncus sp.]
MFTTTGDLHCHSHYSDGAATISQLIGLAKQAGLDVLAITDHETFRGNDCAQILAEGTGLRILKGIEMSAMDPANGRSVHLLCYNPQRVDGIRALCAETADARFAAGVKMARRICQKYPVHMEQILNYTAVSEGLYKTHIMRPLVDLGYTDTYYGGPLFGQLLGPGGSCFEPIAYPSIYRAIEVARASGGWVVIAHPSVYRSMDLVGQLAAQGLIDGVEVDHPRNTEEDKRALRQLADQYGLLVTGGTDYHGHNPQKDHPLGTGTTGDAVLQKLLYSHPQK